MRRVLPSLGVTAILAAATSPVFAVRPPNPYFAGQFGPGGTWNVYEYVSAEKTFDAARADAATRLFTDAGGIQYGGFLADVLSAEENAFLNGRRLAEAWIGLTDAGLNPGSTTLQTSTIDGFQYTGMENSPAHRVVNADRRVGFQWLTGQPVVYINWNGGGEPNDWDGGEDAVEMVGNGVWNDNSGGTTMGDPRNELRDYFIEYYVESPTNPVVVQRPAFIQGGPAIANGAFGIREITGVNVDNVEQAEEIAAGTAGNRTDYLAPVLNLHENGGNGNFGGDRPYATDTNPADGAGNGQVEQTTVLANGRIRVPETGRYTFGVNSDDGFRLEIVGKNFDAVSGQPGTRITGGLLEFPVGRGAQDSFGQITLEAGDYDIQLVTWEGTGGASAELFAAKGAHTTFNDNFALVGGTRVIDRRSPTVGPFSVVVEKNTSSDFNQAFATILERLDGVGVNANTVGPVEANTITFIDPESDFPPQVRGRGAVPFPGDAAGADDNNFTMGARATMTVTPATAGEYTFVIAGDDQTRLQIFGTSGWQVVGKADAVALADGMQDNGCCGDYVGYVTLTPGEYLVQILQTEQVGGSSIGVYLAFGRHAGFNGDFQPFGADIIQQFTVQGLQLVPEPGTLSLVGLGLAALGLRRRRAN